ncbi:calcium channel subunit mid1 [Diplodia corticola]|uniref:Calcium channel subunit mid1 n=1 Tax=Diplodia corticola TaxID=236234 RepID=A0A1J9QL62_9PEZI|nr:calcium channel subunit mid1 [Diplodia corticola]OJD29201.1 calcium channel subunit mid1 [Diplodia corticola]
MTAAAAFAAAGFAALTCLASLGSPASSFSSSSFVAYAAEVSPPSAAAAPGEEADHNHMRLAQEDVMGFVGVELELDDARAGAGADGEDEDEEEEEERRRQQQQVSQYEPAFVGVIRDIIGRQASSSSSSSFVTLTNNEVGTSSILAGKTLYFRFENSSVWGNFSAETPGLPEMDGRKLLSRESMDRELKRRGVGVEVEEEEEEEEEGDEDVDVDVDGKVVLRKRAAATRQVYVSMNTCNQPDINGTTTQEAPPQLTLYISTSDKNKSPGPSAESTLQSTHTLSGGFASATINATSNVYIGVSAPSPLPDGFTGDWQFQVAASIDQSFHQYNEPKSANSFVYLVDTDTNSALFVTDNLTSSDPGEDDYERWMRAGNPFQLFAYSSNMTAIKGMERSYCGLLNAWNEEPSSQISGMTTRGLGNKPKEQFYVQGLNGSTPYFAFPVMYGNSTAAGSGVVGGGGQVWAPVNFTTKADGNCQVIFNLTFCDEVAYAVPSNPNRYNLTTLVDLYDSYAANHYQNFNYSLQQIPCNTTNTAQYSLAKTCDDCAHDYKNWLCAVTIPRCEDFSATDAWLQPRNIAQPFANGTALADTQFGRDNDGANPLSNATLRDRLYANSSRNPIIDEKVQPGPYKEVLPCEDLCYSLIQSCPASFEFACPVRGRGLERSYGNRNGNEDGSVTCSYLGAVYYVNGGASLVMGMGGLVGRSAVVAGATVGWVLWGGWGA